MDLINGFDWVSPGFGLDPQRGPARLRGRYTLVVSEHPGSGSDPPIESDRKGVLQSCSLITSSLTPFNLTILAILTNLLICSLGSSKG